MEGVLFVWSWTELRECQKHIYGKRERAEREREKTESRTEQTESRPEIEK